MKKARGNLLGPFESKITESERMAVCAAQRAGGLVGDNVYGVNTTPRTSGLHTDVLVRSEEVRIGRAVRVDLLLFQRPGRLGAIDLFEVGDAGALLAGAAGFDEVRNGDGRQEGDNRDDDHYFHQG